MKKTYDMICVGEKIEKSCENSIHKYIFLCYCRTLGVFTYYEHTKDHVIENLRKENDGSIEFQNIRLENGNIIISDPLNTAVMIRIEQSLWGILGSLNEELYKRNKGYICEENLNKKLPLTTNSFTIDMVSNRILLSSNMVFQNKSLKQLLIFVEYSFEKDGFRILLGSSSKKDYNNVYSSNYNENPDMCVKNCIQYMIKNY